MAQNTTQNCLRHVGSVMVTIDFAMKFTIESLIFICSIFIVSNQCIITIYHGFFLITVHDGLWIQR